MHRGRRKASDKIVSLGGNAKEALGKVTGDKDTENKGNVDQAKSSPSGCRREDQGRVQELGANLLLLGRHPAWWRAELRAISERPCEVAVRALKLVGDSRPRRGCVERLLIKAMRNQALALNSQRPPHRRHQPAGNGRLSTPEEPVPW
jgi:hypothetical protein